MGRLKALLDDMRSRSRRVFANRGDVGLKETGWTLVLRQAGTELESLNRATESEFLNVGGKLQQYYLNAREIAKRASSVANLMSGQEISGVIDGFRGVLEDVKGLEGESRESSDTLQRVLSILKRMHAYLEGFRQTARVLRVLCVSTRIESAWLGSRDIGFNTLAGDVDKLASEIEQKCAHLMEHSKSLAQLIEQTLARATEIGARQQGQARIILDSVMGSLLALTERHGASSEGVQQISSRYGAISKGIGEIVASLQFHDITRQRIEHVKAALDQACDGYDRQEESPACEEDGRSAADLVPLRFLSDTCELQRAQLSHAGSEFNSAVGNIIGNLRDIARHVAEISEETRKMVGNADELGKSSLTEIEAGFSSVGSALSGYSSSCRELHLAMESVAATLGNMSIYARDIEGIGTKIKLIALNAIVKSCHMGDEGAALGVLAEAIHRLSVDTCEQTATVCESFRDIIAAAGSLADGTSLEGGTGIAEADRMAERLEELMSRLKEVNDGIVSLLIRMDEDGRGLSEDIESSAEDIHSHEVMHNAIGHMVACLEDIVQHSRVLLPPVEDAQREERLRALESSYTMQGEREIHQSIISGAAAAATIVVPEDSFGDVELFDMEEEPPRDAVVDTPEARAGEVDLGDNIELFGPDEPVGEEQKPEGGEESSEEEDLGDNVELF